MVNEDGTIVRGEGAGDGGATKRSAEVLDGNGNPDPSPEPLVIRRKRALRFDASDLKGRPLF